MAYKTLNSVVQIICDSDWSSNLDDRNLFSIIATKIGDNLVHWQSQNQLQNGGRICSLISQSQGSKNDYKCF